MNVRHFLGSVLPSHATLCCMLHETRAVSTLVMWAAALRTRARTGAAVVGRTDAALAHTVSEASATFLAAMARGEASAFARSSHIDTAINAAADVLGLGEVHARADGSSAADVSLLAQHRLNGVSLLDAMDMQLVMERMQEVGAQV